MAPTQVPVSEEASSELAQEVLAGRYALKSLLGGGAMGCVYRAHDNELDEIVALKVLRTEVLNVPGILDRFRQEVKLARRVTHRNVARMFDIGSHGDVKFLTMEFIEGTCLGSLISRDTVVSPRRAVDIVAEVCLGLEAAHATGIVHRDLKPENIIVARDGRVVLADFGIARAVGGATHTMAGTMVGTPAYMSPEQVRADEVIDGRADLYAIGVMLFELVTGDVPWSGNNPIAVAMARLSEPVPDPRKLAPDLSPQLVAVIQKCMAKEPGDRYATPAELARALRSLSNDLLERPSVPPPSSKIPSTVRLVGFHSMHGVDDGRVARAREPNHEDRLARTVVVLPFRLVSAPGFEHVAEALSEDVSDLLSRQTGLRVRPPSMARSFLAENNATLDNIDVRVIGKSLNVQAVLSGTVRMLSRGGLPPSLIRSANEPPSQFPGGNDGSAAEPWVGVRVTARVTMVNDGYQIWADRFERASGEYLSFADDIVSALGDVLTFESPQADAPAAVDPLALDAYLRGRNEYTKFWRDGNARPHEFFREAHDRSPDDVRINSAYALALVRSFALDDRARPAGEQGRVLAEAALGRDAQHAEAHVALAVYYNNVGKYMEAARHVGRALRTGNSSADAHEMAGSLLAELGPVREALVHFRVAMEREPRLFNLAYRMARAYALLGDWPQAWATLGKTPKDPSAQNLWFLFRARLALWRGDVAIARECKAALATKTFYFRDVASWLCDVVLDNGVPAALIALVTQWEAATDSTRSRAFLEQVGAEAFASVKDDAAVYRCCEGAFAAGLVDAVWLAQCPLFDRLQTEARFIELRARVQGRADAALASFSEE